MAPYKPMKIKEYRAWLRQYGWTLVKAGKDWKVLDEKGGIKVRNVILTHPGNEGIAAISIDKTKKALEAENMI